MQRISSNLSHNDFQYHLRRRDQDMYRVQNQMASQERVQNLRDDPVAAAHSTRYQSVINRLDRFVRNGDEVQSRLRITEGHLNGALGLMQRLNEMAIQGANGIYTGEDLQNMGVEVDQLLQELVSLANAQTAEGQPVFSGDRTGSLPFRVVEGFVPGGIGTQITEVEYVGTIGERQAEINDQTHMAMGIPGNEAFWAENQQVYSNLDAQAYRVAADTSIYIDGQEIPLTQGDNVQTIIAKINSADVAVRGRMDPVSGGMILETTVPHQLWLQDNPDNPVLADLGILRQGEGRPPHNYNQDARVFGGSMFDAVIQLRDSFMAGDSEALGGRQLSRLRGAMDHLLTNMASLGARDSRLDVNRERLEHNIPQLTERNSRLMDLDLAEGITELKMLEFTHQAALSSSARIFQKTLLDFIR